MPTPLQDPAQPAAYDSFAEAYATENESSLFNAWYERPEILRLAGDVAGARVLDAGCGSGPLAAALQERGARVTGLDASAAMVDAVPITEHVPTDGTSWSLTSPISAMSISSARKRAQ